MYAEPWLNDEKKMQTVSFVLLDTIRSCDIQYAILPSVPESSTISAGRCFCPVDHP